jgi:hypothetical protein
MVLLTGALCADRLAVPAPTVRPQMTDVARQMAGRLVSSLRRVLPAVRIELARRDERPVDDSDVARAPAAARAVVHAHVSPLQLRTPPPAA